MVAYNILNRKYVESALAKAHKADIGVIAMKVARPVYMGAGRTTLPERVKLIEDAMPGGSLKAPQKAYVWALKSPALAAVISEMGNAALVKDNLPLAGTKPGA